jgi:hypothetical protein
VGARQHADRPDRLPVAGTRGIVSRRDSLHDGEITVVSGMFVTTPSRIAYDLGRWSHDETVARLDALGNATRFDRAEVLAIVRRHPRARDVRRLLSALESYDARAQSPKETWLRLLLIDAGFPRPRTQIPVLGPDGYPRYFLDMGREDVMVAVEYDGEQHRLDRNVYRDDIIRSEYVAARTGGGSG